MLPAASRRSKERVPDSRADDIVKLLQSYGLPTVGEFDPERVSDLIGNDKKRVGGKTSWVLLEAQGGVSISREVSDKNITGAIATVRAA